MPKRVLSRVVPLLALTVAAPSAAQMSKSEVASFLDAREERLTDIAMQIWDLAEVGYLEEESSALLAGELEAHGFVVEWGVAGMPTAFVATYGSGSPVIGVLGEFDALPGINQAAVPYRQPIEGKIAGHACGHHLFGTASSAAAIGAAEWLKRTGSVGTKPHARACAAGDAPALRDHLWRRGTERRSRFLRGLLLRQTPRS